MVDGYQFIKEGVDTLSVSLDVEEERFCWKRREWFLQIANLHDLQVCIRIHGHIVEVNCLVVCYDADARGFRIGEIVEALFDGGDYLVKEAVDYGS